MILYDAIYNTNVLACGKCAIIALQKQRELDMKRGILIYRAISDILPRELVAQIARSAFVTGEYLKTAY